MLSHVCYRGKRENLENSNGVYENRKKYMSQYSKKFVGISCEKKLNVRFNQVVWQDFVKGRTIVY